MDQDIEPGTRSDVEPARISFGCEGLDDILGGGVDPDRVYLLEGRPGAGKTTLALQFLLDGARRGERVLYVTLSESEHELRSSARRHGWSLDAISIFELVPPEATLDPERELTLLHPAEMELSETTQLILERVRLEEPARVVFDSLSEMRLLAQNPLRYRRQILALKHFFNNRKCTVVLLDDLSSHADDLQLHSIAHGVVTLEQMAVDYGANRRRLRVVKMRGIDYRGGFHDFIIKRGGLAVFPRLVAAEHHVPFDGTLTSCGVAGVDRLVGGGLERGTSALLIGPAGIGKSTVALLYSIAAAERGERSAIFAFDEGEGTILARAAGLGLNLRSHIESGLIRLTQIDPAEMSPGEFAHLVRASIEADTCRVVVIDSLNGYLNAMPDERFLILQMHELLSYLNQLGVLTLLVLAQHGMVGPMQTPLDISYLSDAVMMLRYFEANGTVHRAISVVKKRSGPHELAMHEFRLSRRGMEVGPPLLGFSNVLSGTPIYHGNAPLLGEGSEFPQPV